MNSIHVHVQILYADILYLLFFQGGKTPSAVTEDKLRYIGEKFSSYPDGFNIHSGQSIYYY